MPKVTKPRTHTNRNLVASRVQQKREAKSKYTDGTASYYEEGDSRGFAATIHKNVQIASHPYSAGTKHWGTISRKILKLYKRKGMPEAVTIASIANPRTLGASPTFYNDIADSLMNDGESIFDNGITRNHILSDSNISYIMVSIYNTVYERNKETFQGMMNNGQRMALEEFFSALVDNKTKTQLLVYLDRLTYPAQIEHAPTILAVISDLSIGQHNVRLGSRTINGHVLTSFDPNFWTRASAASALAPALAAIAPSRPQLKRQMTGGSNNIYLSVLTLASVGLIDDQVAKNATQIAIVKSTGAELTSTDQSMEGNYELDS
ncbi:hypothetical protein [Fibrivirga algicola]|nr:hypothetical protein [Fibrivirga algicola]